MQIEEVKLNYADFMDFLGTKSYQHQIIGLEGKAIKRYVKTTISHLTAWRKDFWNSTSPTAIMKDGRLIVGLYTDTNGWDKVSAIPFRYVDNVIELYSDTDVRSFEQMNRSIIESGAIVEFVDGNYEFMPQRYDYMIVDHGDRVEQIPIPRDFVLVEKVVSVNHNIAVKPLKRG